MAVKSARSQAQPWKFDMDNKSHKYWAIGSKQPKENKEGWETNGLAGWQGPMYKAVESI